MNVRVDESDVVDDEMEIGLICFALSCVSRWTLVKVEIHASAGKSVMLECRLL